MSERAARVLVIADWRREDIADVRDRVVRIVESRARDVERIATNGDERVERPEADLAVVIGGDGTIMREIRHFAETDTPIVGVNVGRLGFLAEFDVDGLEAQAEAIFADRAPIATPMLLRYSVECAAEDESRPADRAVNDLAITSGPPYTMIRLQLEIDGEAGGPTLDGDGLIAATPTGSTAYSVSAGGPIVQPQLDALVLTPVAAHSLAFRPIVVGGDAEIRVRVERANPGTALLRDGHVVRRLDAGDCIEIRRDEVRGRLVLNPTTNYWRIVQDKLQWAAPPMYRRPEA